MPRALKHSTENVISSTILWAILHTDSLLYPAILHAVLSDVLVRVRVPSRAQFGAVFSHVFGCRLCVVSGDTSVLILPLLWAPLWRWFGFHLMCFWTPFQHYFVRHFTMGWSVIGARLWVLLGCGIARHWGAALGTISLAFQSPFRHGFAVKSDFELNFVIYLLRFTYYLVHLSSAFQIPF